MDLSVETVEAVAPANEVNWRELRTAVIWRKLSFGLQNSYGGRFVATIPIVAQTCRQQSRNVVRNPNYAYRTPLCPPAIGPPGVNG